MTLIIMPLKRNNEDRARIRDDYCLDCGGNEDSVNCHNLSFWIWRRIIRLTWDSISILRIQSCNLKQLNLWTKNNAIDVERK